MTDSLGRDITQAYLTEVSEEVGTTQPSEKAISFQTNRSVSLILLAVEAVPDWRSALAVLLMHCQIPVLLAWGLAHVSLQASASSLAKRCCYSHSCLTYGCRHFWLHLQAATCAVPKLLWSRDFSSADSQGVIALPSQARLSAQQTAFGQ